MIDNFALLGEPRRPWLDPGELKEKFLQLSAEVHPDRVHNANESEKALANERYAELNAACKCLSEPKDRLLHLLELELGAKPRDVQRIPPGTMELFVEVGQTCRDADSFLAEKNRATSPLLKVQMFERSMEWSDKLSALQQRIHGKRDELLGETKAFNPLWEAAPPVGSINRAAALPLDRLENIYRTFSYVARWTEQLQERLVQLSM